jgi:single-strand DNA-binding protein
VIGNLTADPELRFSQQGVAVATFTVAASRRVYDKASGQWSDGDTLFLRCSAFPQLAENCVESLTRGSRALVTGRLRQRSYQDRDGVTRTVFEVDVEDVGPSLKWATAEVSKVERERASHPAGPVASVDPWAVGPAPVGAGAGFSGEPAAMRSSWVYSQERETSAARAIPATLTGLVVRPAAVMALSAFDRASWERLRAACRSTS